MQWIVVVVCTMSISVQAAPYFVACAAVYLDISAAIGPSSLVSTKQIKLTWSALYSQLKKALLGPKCLVSRTKKLVPRGLHFKSLPLSTLDEFMNLYYSIKYHPKNRSQMWATVMHSVVWCAAKHTSYNCSHLHTYWLETILWVLDSQMLWSYI